MTASVGDLDNPENAIWQAVSQADTGFLTRTMAPDFFELGRSGRRYSRDDIQSGLDQQPGVTCLLHDVAVQTLSAQIALVTRVSEVRYGRWANRSSVWDCAAGHWQPRFHQGKPIDSPKKARK